MMPSPSRRDVLEHSGFSRRQVITHFERTGVILPGGQRVIAAYCAKNNTRGGRDD